MSGIIKPLKFILIKQAEDNKRLAHVCGTCRMGQNKKNLLSMKIVNLTILRTCM